MAQERTVRVHPESTKILFEESKEAFDSLNGVLDEYRANVTKVLGLVTAAAALFAFEDSRKELAFWIAIGLYFFAVLLGGSLYNPTRWRINIAEHVPGALATRGADLPPAKLHYDLARRYQTAHNENLEAINGSRGVSRRFRWMLYLVAATITLMLYNSATTDSDGDSNNNPVRIIIEDGGTTP